MEDQQYLNQPGSERVRGLAPVGQIDARRRHGTLKAMSPPCRKAALEGRKAANLAVQPACRNRIGIRCHQVPAVGVEL